MWSPTLHQRWGVEAREGGREQEGQRLIILSCPVKTNMWSRLVERSSTDAHHPSLETEVSRLHPHGSFRPLLAALLISSVSTLKAGFLASSHRLGWRGGREGTQRLVYMGGMNPTHVLHIRAHWAMPSVPLCLSSIWRLSWGPRLHWGLWKAGRGQESGKAGLSKTGDCWFWGSTSPNQTSSPTFWN